MGRDGKSEENILSRKKLEKSIKEEIQIGISQLRQMERNGRGLDKKKKKTSKQTNKQSVNIAINQVCFYMRHLVFCQFVNFGRNGK